ncbi:MAG: hypothetical protein QOE97_3777 [Pseudonocardiales bacterium]|nr:hypothetical protein [Pseudonocardiales bacterium]
MSEGSHSCQGFTVNSDYSFLFTRPGVSRDQLSVVPMLGEPPSADQPQILDWQTELGVVARLYGGGRIFTFWADAVGWFRIAPFDGTIEVPDRDTDALRREVQLWGVPTMLAFTRRGDLSLHAAAIAIGDSAVLVAAPGRFGKTTLSVAFHEAGHRLLSEDISRLQLDPEPLVMPGPAIVRMREDTFSGIPPAGMSVASRARGRVELAIDDERRGDSRPVPVRAVVLLRESADDRIQLERVETMDAIPDLWTLAFRLPESDDRSRAFQQVAAFADRVPVWNLFRPVTMGGLPDVVATVAELCES